ncbi:MAG: 4-hydroxy-3-methylbut-2-enyl diphosphate reductase [Endomicrobiia bacterium]|nr:4-hydroxy-3-methylbut-2-enyl diphosphate reductase [Endomicrobiia bacterium]
MKITIAKNSGFCFGVKRAVAIVEKLSDAGRKIYTNGPIIHNPQVIKSLAVRGVKALKSSDDAMGLKKGLLVIRTHGMKKDFPSQVPEKVRIIDATCPFVKRAQDIVKRLSVEGRRVIILGDEHHPEVEGLVSYADSAVVIKNPKEAAKLDINKGRVGFLSQTTQSVGDFAAISRRIKKKNPSALIFDTICRTTSLRQSEVEEIARKSDIMIIVGGKNSANTKRLAAISRKHTVTYHIETSRELKKKWFGKAFSVGIAAGASTPDRIIKEVAERIKKIGGR